MLNLFIIAFFYSRSYSAKDLVRRIFLGINSFPNPKSLLLLFSIINAPRRDCHYGRNKDKNP